MKRICTFLASILFAVCSFGQSDYEIAKSFMEKHGVSIENKSTTRTDMPYSIFNGENGVGFAIVKNKMVVGYSTNGQIGEIPPQLKEMLEGGTRYADEYPEEFVPRNLSPIGPLVRCQWGQGYPYNEKCPTIGGKHCLTGCCATAVAQLLYYYRLPYGCKEYGEGCISGVDEQYEHEYLPAVKFDYDNMLETYRDGNYTQKEVDAVATLMRYCGRYALSKYGLNETLGVIGPFPDDFDVEIHDELVYYFSFDESILYGDSEITDDGILAILDEELEAKRPVLVLGGEDGCIGHAYLIDGRDSEGLYHINWGWYGDGNGYYIVSRELYKKYGPINGIGNFCKYLNLLAVHGSLEYTSIKSITNNSKIKDKVYNLQGMVVGDTLDGLPRGVYIQNGKKYMVK